MYLYHPLYSDQDLRKSPVKNELCPDRNQGYVFPLRASAVLTQLCAALLKTTMVKERGIKITRESGELTRKLLMLSAILNQVTKECFDTIKRTTPSFQTLSESTVSPYVDAL